MNMEIGGNSMTSRIAIIYTICAALTISIISSHAATVDGEALGRKAESEGRFRAALTHYIDALQTVTEARERDLELRKAIIKISLKLQPTPPVPEAAVRHMARGEAVVENASNNQDYLQAEKEFKMALKYAPWYADIYFNLGVVQDKAGKYNEAIGNLKLYLVAAPDDKAAKKLMYKIEYRAEEAQRKSNNYKRLSPFEDLAGYYVSKVNYRRYKMEFDGGRFKIYYIGMYDPSNGRFLPSRARIFCEGIIQEDLSLSGSYLQDQIYSWRKDNRGVWLTYFPPYNKTWRINGRITQDGQRIDVDFPEHYYEHPRSGGDLRKRTNKHSLYREQ
jgi:tetratricopeptide (TPR) repeat protein